MNEMKVKNVPKRGVFLIFISAILTVKGRTFARKS